MPAFRTGRICGAAFCNLRRGGEGCSGQRHGHSDSQSEQFAIVSGYTPKQTLPTQPHFRPLWIVCFSLPDERVSWRLVVRVRPEGGWHPGFGHSDLTRAATVRKRATRTQSLHKNALVTKKTDGQPRFWPPAPAHGMSFPRRRESSEIYEHRPWIPTRVGLSINFNSLLAGQRQDRGSVCPSRMVQKGKNIASLWYCTTFL